MRYKVIGRDFRRNGETHKPGDIVDVPGGDGEIFARQGRLKRTTAKKPPEPDPVVAEPAKDDESL